MVKVFKFNEHDKIEFTQKELETLLNEVYDEGYTKGKNQYIWTSPYYYSSKNEKITLNDKNNYNITTTTGNTPIQDKIEITY